MMHTNIEQPIYDDDCKRTAIVFTEVTHCKYLLEDGDKKTGDKYEFRKNIEGKRMATVQGKGIDGGNRVFVLRSLCFLFNNQIQRRAGALLGAASFYSTSRSELANIQARMRPMLMQFTTPIAARIQ